MKCLVGVDFGVEDSRFVKADFGEVVVQEESCSDSLEIEEKFYGLLSLVLNRASGKFCLKLSNSRRSALIYIPTGALEASEDSVSSDEIPCVPLLTII